MDGLLNSYFGMSFVNGLMLLRNLIQCSPFLAAGLNLVGGLPLYRRLIERQMQNA
ncbi:MAG: hypothetical protein J6Y94_09220 [Bacteriovoracaceae bacterium]|nr:hypothetical protein [Bacteriovoracaceae bacterium]